MALRFPFRVKATSSTTGTGTYTIAEPAVAGWRTFTRAVTDGDLADGDTVAYIVVDTTIVNGPKLCEVGTGVWNNTAKTLTRATVLQPNGAAVSWGAGTRDIFVVNNPLLYLMAANNLSDLAAAATARANLGLGSAALLAAGTGANQVVQLTAAAKYPAVDGSLITGLPSSPIPAGTVMVFYQAAAPSGWTRHATIDNQVIRIVKSGSLIGTAGTLNGGAWVITGLTADSHTLTAAELPATAVVNTTTIATASSGAASLPVATGGGGGHTHGVTSSGIWTPPSADCLLATKN